MEDLLRIAIQKFNEAVKKDVAIQTELEGVVRKVQIEVSDGKWYHFVLQNKQIENFGEGEIENPDIRIISDSTTIAGLLNKEIRPMKAWATRKLQIKASLSDLLRLKKFF